MALVHEYAIDIKIMTFTTFCIECSEFMLFQEIGKMYLLGKNYMDKEVNTDPGSRA